MGYVFLYGPFVSPAILKRRNIGFANVASTNRMLRIISALKGQFNKVAIIAPGVSANTKGHKIVRKKNIERINNIPVVTLGQFFAGFFGVVLSPLAAILAAFRLRKKRVSLVIQYNFYPDALAFSLACRLLHGSKVVFDLEDVCKPVLKDWFAKNGIRPFQQLWGWVLMRLSLIIADYVIVPSERFLKEIPTSKEVLVISGCQQIVCASPIVRVQPHDTIKLLYSGKITVEHGAFIFMDALLLLDSSERTAKLEFHVCGAGSSYEWLRQESKSKLKNLKVVYHGFMTNKHYQALLEKIDVCCILQDPDGRHANYKTPSKGYEALCAGKTIVVTNVGDFALLPADILFLLDDYSGKCLAKVINDFSMEEVLNKRKSAYHFALQNWSEFVVGQKIAELLKNEL